MANDFIGSIVGVCKVLNKHRVNYLVVGGTAVAFYGYYRLSRDMAGEIHEKYDFDFWYNPTYENYFNLLNAMEELGVDVSSLKNEVAPNPRKSYLRHEFEEFKTDFLPDILGLGNFAEALSGAEEIDMWGDPVFVLSKDDLIKSKKALMRNKDIDDIDALEHL